eukprot:6205654-Pleurochrysis_carterae.AAC.1
MATLQCECIVTEVSASSIAVIFKRWRATPMFRHPLATTLRKRMQMTASRNAQKCDDGNGDNDSNRANDGAGDATADSYPGNECENPAEQVGEDSAEGGADADKEETNNAAEPAEAPTEGTGDGNDNAPPAVFNQVVAAMRDQVVRSNVELHRGCTLGIFKSLVNRYAPMHCTPCLHMLLWVCRVCTCAEFC